jgi:hypothetical protein
MTDLTVGDFDYYGPSMKVDYSLRLWPRLFVGAGLDYDISTGLKEQYTSPEIVHNNFVGNLGVIYEARENWQVGLIARPIRLQNRTQFAKTDEGFDNLIHRYYGDGIYDVLATGSYTARELLKGVELGLQNFMTTDRLQIGTQFSYRYSRNKIRYGTSNQLYVGYWQSTVYDLRFLARYAPAEIPLKIGLTGGYMNDDGWATRPEYDNVLLYENPLSLVFGGAGVSYRVRPNVLTSLEYVANFYDIEASDYGAGLHRSSDIVQNIGRLGVEYDVWNLHSIRLGVEVTDFLVDRWIKQPSNTDRYRFTGGFRYRTGFWDIEGLLAYSRDTRENSDTDREGLSGIVWFSRLLR